MDRYRTIATQIAERCDAAGYCPEYGTEMWVTEITKALAAVAEPSVPRVPSRLPAQPVPRVVPVAVPSTPHETTQSTEEAMALLKRARTAQIDQARILARELITRDGTTHTRIVRDTLMARGLFDTTVPEYWLGAIFRSRDFVFTGEFYDAPSKEGDASKNTHARNIVKVWRLRHAGDPT